MKDDAAGSSSRGSARRVRRVATVAEASDPRLRASRQPRPEDSDNTLTRPHLTLPSVPIIPSNHPNQPAPPSQPGQSSPSGRHSLLSKLAVGQAPRPQPDDPWQEYGQETGAWESGNFARPRSRANSSARPLNTLQSAILPAIPEPQPPAEYDDYDQDDAYGGYGAYAGDDGYDGYEQDHYAVDDHRALAALSTESVPNLAAYRSSPRNLPARVPVYTRAIIKQARSPWNMARAVFAIVAITIALGTMLTKVGEPPLSPLSSGADVGLDVTPTIASQVPAFTQMKRPDLYDSIAQFNAWDNAACSAAVTAEVLTAWGVQGMTIGKVIDEMGSYISTRGGLLNYKGFQQSAAKHGFRGDFLEGLTYDQMLYLTTRLGIPLIVNVRINYGYYHFFDGGHFLVVTGGDKDGLKIVDSSLYYVKYLPKSVFYSMFTGRAELIVPENYQYTLPK